MTQAVDALRAAAAEIEKMADALTAGRPVELNPAVTRVARCAHIS